MISFIQKINFFRRLFLEMIGKNWSRGGEKFGGDTGKDVIDHHKHVIFIQSN